jgi:undecaprenyl-diphosphatase
LISPQVTRFMVDITNLGGVYLIVIASGAMALFLLYKRYWWDFFAFFLAAGGGETILIVLKLLFHRQRPTAQLITVHGYSFPSGHAFAAMIVYGYLIHITWRLLKSEVLRFLIFSLSILLILLVGMSRIYLNVHWLTDVLGGYASGFAWLVFSIVMVNTMRQMTATEGNR